MNGLRLFAQNNLVKFKVESKLQKYLKGYTAIVFERIFTSPDLYEFTEAEMAELTTVTSLEEMRVNNRLISNPPHRPSTFVLLVAAGCLPD